jgi:hypothetical protein
LALKFSGTLLLSAALVFGAVAAASPAPPPATAAPDPAILARARSMFAALQTGKIDRSQLDAQANSTIDDATIRRAHDAVVPLGTPVTFEQQNVFARNGITNYVYLVTFGGGQSLDFGFLLDSAGKVAGMAILPPPSQ